MNTIKDYLESGRALQAKYDEIRTGVLARKNILEEHYEPLITPLREISSTLKTNPPPSQQKVKVEEKKKLTLSTEQKKLLDSIGPLAYEYLYNANPSERDVTFGIYIKDKVAYIGNLPLSIKNDIIKVKDFKFLGTRGLWELLTLKQPKNYEKHDLEVYEFLVLSSFTYRHNNDPNSSNVKSSSGKKYLKIIKPMLTRYNKQHEPSLVEEMSSASQKEEEEVEGSGLRKVLTNAPVEYVYWNNLDELLDRMYIVYGEIKSGNNNPNLVNELVNILQEIREI